MSYRNIMFEKKKIPRKKNHKWRKFQKSKTGIYKAINSKGNIVAESDSYEEYLDQFNSKTEKERNK